MQGTASRLPGTRFAHFVGVGAIALCVAAGSIGCSDNADDNTHRSDAALELYNWLINGGEVDALNALIGLYRQDFPQTSVIKASGNSIGASIAQLHVRMQGVPPDTFQSVGGQDILQWVFANGQDDADSKLEPLNDIVADSGIISSIPEHLRAAVSFNSTLYAVPLGIHRVNSLFYNVNIFQRLGLNPPETLAEFYSVAATLKAAGYIPLSIGVAEGDIISDLLFDGLLIAKAGVPYREAYLSGQMDAEPAGQPIMDALNELAKLLDYTNEDRDRLLWPDAAAKLFAGNVNGGGPSAAMTYVGDWARGFLKVNGMIPWVPGAPDIDPAKNYFGQVPLFGTKGAFVYVVDAFTLPKGALHRQASVNFLHLIATRQAEDTFNPPKGSIPPRTDDNVALDPVAASTLSDFRDPATTLTLSRIPIVKSPEFKAELEAVMRNFSADRKVETMRHFLENRYDEL